MNLTKKAHLSELRKYITTSTRDRLIDRHRVLKSILDCWKKKQSLLHFAYFLEDKSDRVVQSFVAEAFAYANDERVLKHLMNAAIAPDNNNYNSTFIWPCAKYDCTKYLNFFVNYISKNDEPNEAMLACVDVIEEMKGPFEPNSLKRNVRTLLSSNKASVRDEFRALRELLRTQAAYALLDKYFGQVDKECKA